MAMSEAAKAAKAAYNKKYQQEHPDKMREYKRRWAAKNPDKIRACNERYWERKAAAMAAGADKE